MRNRSNSNQFKRLSVLNLVTIIFIPTISIVEVIRGASVLLETTFYWPWLILIRLQPDAIYLSDQWLVSGFPWNLLIFAPFLYAVRASIDLYQSSENRNQNVLYVSLAALVQLLIIFVMSKSQFGVTEEVKIYYVPQILLLVINGFIGLTGSFNEYQEKLTAAKKSKLNREEIKNID